MAKITRSGKNTKRRIAMAGAGLLGASALMLVPSVGEAGSPHKARELHAKIVDKKIKKICAIHANFHAHHPGLPMHKGIICPPASP